MRERNYVHYSPPCIESKTNRNTDGIWLFAWYIPTKKLNLSCWDSQHANTTLIHFFITHPPGKLPLKTSKVNLMWRAGCLIVDYKIYFHASRQATGIAVSNIFSVFLLSTLLYTFLFFFLCFWVTATSTLSNIFWLDDDCRMFTWMFEYKVITF